MASTLDYLRGIPAEKWTYAYQPGKWTLAESWIHVIDTERIFAYRALRIGRGLYISHNKVQIRWCLVCSYYYF